MWMWMPQPKLARQMGQAVTGSHGEKHPSQIQGVEELVGLAVAVTVHKVGEVEVAAVGHDGTVTDEVDQLGDHLLRLGSRGDIDIADAGELLDRARDSDFRANQRLEAGQDLIALERSEEHTSELQSHSDLVCRLLLEKKKNRAQRNSSTGGSRRDYKKECPTR